jgi:hypothetical protein
VAEKGIEPSRSKAPADFESAASASSATRPLAFKLIICGSFRKCAGAGWLEKSSANSDSHWQVTGDSLAVDENFA